MLTLATAEGAAAAATRRHRHTPGCSSRFPASVPASCCSAGGAPTGSARILAVGLSWASFVVGFVVIVAMVGRDADDRAHARCTLYDWLPAGQFQLDARACSSTRCR